MNKKGDVPSVIILVATLVLVTSALIVFLTFNKSLKVFPEKTDNLARMVDFSEDYVKSKARFFASESIKNSVDYKANFVDIARENEINVVQFGNFFAKIRNEEFEFEKMNDKYILKINDLFVMEEIEHNQIIRRFNICMEFDEKGDFVRYCTIDKK